MKTRPLQPAEEANLQAVRQSAGEYALLFPTPNGIKKSILDATLPHRTLLKEKGIHEFAAQAQGIANKVSRDAVVVSDSKSDLVKVSYYRPPTKEGDPRFWPSRFGDHCAGDDVVAVFVVEGRVHYLNLTRSTVAADLAARRDTHATRFLGSIKAAVSVIPAQLLKLLRDVAAKGPLKGVSGGDTSIGRSIEAALGIGMNARKMPDYHGIELKSYRAHKPENGLITLFAKVPDWKRSLLKRSKDYLDRFGYDRDGRRQLYCSVYLTKANSQGLRLHLNTDVNDLQEYHKDKREEVLAVWSMDTLHADFSAKHAETFWIKADREVRSDGLEYFTLHSVIHTRRAIVPQFDAFLLAGQICLDHTIKQKGAGTKDHGYLFRVRQEKFTELFTGEPARYDLA